MYLILATLILLGAVCGATIRLLPFIFVLLGASVIAAVSAGIHGGEGSWLYAILAVVILQVGYALGIVGRAMHRSWRQRRANVTTEKSAQPVPSRIPSKVEDKFGRPARGR